MTWSSEVGSDHAVGGGLQSSRELHSGSDAPGRDKDKGLFGDVVLVGKAKAQAIRSCPHSFFESLHYLSMPMTARMMKSSSDGLEIPTSIFTGEEFYKTMLPCDSSSLPAGSNGAKVASRKCWRRPLRWPRGLIIKEADLQKAIIDTMVQEKTIAYPTDSRLIEKHREMLIKVAEESQFSRQNYSRVVPTLIRQAGGYVHFKQFKRMQRVIKKQRTLTGWVRGIEWQIDGKPGIKTKPADLLINVSRTLIQQPKDKSRLYSLHAPEVECISKGKAKQLYEIDVKLGGAVTHKQRTSVGARSFTGDPYDGDTFPEQLEQVGILNESQLATAFVDLGYRVRGNRSYSPRQTQAAKPNAKNSAQMPTSRCTCDWESEVGPPHEQGLAQRPTRRRHLCCMPVAAIYIASWSYCPQLFWRSK